MIDDDAVLAAHDRLAALAAYDLDDPRLRRRLDALAERTAAELGQPVGLVTLVLDSAQVLAGASGVPDWLEAIRGTPVEWSFCANTVVRGEPYLVPDAATDPAQRDNPLVTVDGIASYAGYPLTTPEGHVLGAQCVIGSSPHEFTPAEVEVLRAAAAEAVTILEEHRLPRRGAGATRQAPTPAPAGRAELVVRAERRHAYLLTRTAPGPAAAELLCGALLDVPGACADHVTLDAFSPHREGVPPQVLDAQTRLRRLQEERDHTDSGRAVRIERDDPEQERLLRVYAPWSGHVELRSGGTGRTLVALRGGARAARAELTDEEATGLRRRLDGVADVELLADVEQRERARAESERLARREERRRRLRAWWGRLTPPGRTHPPDR